MRPQEDHTGLYSCLIEEDPGAEQSGQGSESLSPELARAMSGAGLFPKQEKVMVGHYV